MTPFKILNKPEESLYFKPAKNRDDEEDGKIFYSDVKEEFLKEFKKHSGIKNQVGHSTKHNCDYISVILVVHYNGDGEFTGHGIRSTCLIKDKSNNIIDKNDNTEEYGEVGRSINTVYHHLLSGKLLEISLKKPYEDSMEDIYQIVSNARNMEEIHELVEGKGLKEKKGKRLVL